MAVTAAYLQQSILDEIGAELPDVKPALDKVKPTIGEIWEQWAYKAQIHPTLQYLYAKRTALDKVIGQFRNLTDANLAVLNPRLGQKVDRMVDSIRKAITADIKDVEKQAVARGSGVVGAMTRTAPIERPDESYPDPNGRIYRGDPLERYSDSRWSR